MDFVFEAYAKYLECTLRITTKLMQDVRKEGNLVQITSETVKFVRLAHQCMERILVIVNSMGKSSSSRTLQFSGQMDRGPTAGSLPGSRSAPVTPNTPIAADQNDGRGRLFSSPQAHPFLDYTPSITRQKSISPMEVAYRQNQVLMTAYKSRLQNLKSTAKGAANFNLSLTIQRKMAENLAIAKIQEEALQKKMKERQQRLEEQANRKFSDTVGHSQEEEEKREIYKKVLEYEQDSQWLIDHRKKLEEDPKDFKLIQEIILGVLRCSDHPLTEKLKSYQYKIYEKTFHLVSEKLEEIQQIKVPLPENLYPAGVSTDSSEDEVTSDESDDDNSGDSVILDNVDDDVDENVNDVEVGAVDDRTTADHGDSGVLNDLNKDDGMDSDENVSSNLETNQTQIKKDLEKAIAKSEKFEQKLQLEEKKTQQAVRQVSKDYEKYSLENMDDLFDDDDEDDDGDGDEDNDEGGDKWSCSIDQSTMEKKDRNTTLEVKKLNTSKEDTPTEPNNTESRSDAQPEYTETENSSDSNQPNKATKVRPQISVLSRRNSSTSMKRQKPIVEDVQAMDERIKEMKNEAYHRHIKSVSADVQVSLEKLQNLFAVVYEQLDTTEGRDQCYACLEKPFFQPVWPNILALFRLANSPREVAVAYVMTRNRRGLPRDYKVSKKLRLEEGSESYPYKQAVEELQSLSKQYTLLDKLECLVRCSRQICQCVEDYYAHQDGTDHKKTPSIGADDLLPILCYVIVKTEQPQIVSECHIMEEFIHEGYIMGEEGYCLTSLQTALAYLTSLGMTKS